MSKPEQRRRFLGRMVWGIQALLGAILGALMTAASVVPVLSGRGSDWVPLVDFGQLTDRPRPVAFHFRQTQGWLTEEKGEDVFALLEDGRPVVFSSRCTHLGCSVHWESSLSRFQCPCHGGAYDSGGEVVSGPPPLPLPRFHTEVRDNMVWIRRT